MIYLIDDKGERQKNLGWSKDVLMKYKEILIPIYTAYFRGKKTGNFK